MFGSVPQPLPRHRRLRERALDAANLDRIVGEADGREASVAAGATAAGDWRRMRGVPVQARGVGGAVAGSEPVRALLAKDRRRQT